MLSLSQWLRIGGRWKACGDCGRLPGLLLWVMTAMPGKAAKLSFGPCLYYNMGQSNHPAANILLLCYVLQWQCVPKRDPNGDEVYRSLKESRKDFVC